MKRLTLPYANLFKLVFVFQNSDVRCSTNNSNEFNSDSNARFVATHRNLLWNARPYRRVHFMCLNGRRTVLCDEFAKIMQKGNNNEMLIDNTHILLSIDMPFRRPMHTVQFSQMFVNLFMEQSRNGQL